MPNLKSITLKRFLWVSFLLMFILWGIEKIELIIKKGNKFIINLLPWLVCLLMVTGGLCIVALLDPLPAPEIYLVLYQISFFVLCISIVLPIIKIPSSSEGIIIMNGRPIKKRWVSLISFYSLDSLPRELQTDYVVKKIFNGKIVNELRYKVKVDFSLAFFERIRNAGEVININKIIYSIQKETEDTIKKEFFNKWI